MILKKLIIIFLTAFVTWGCGNSKEGSSENSSDENNETTDTPSTSENNATSTGTSSQTDEPRNWNELTGNEETPDINWIKIENGTFTFGSAPNSPCRGAYDEEEVEVELTNSFVMASTEITKAQWKALDLPHVPWWEGENKPVTRINFYEAALWCNKLSMLEGLDTCYNLDNCKNQVGTWMLLDDHRMGSLF
jgi:formylglycine-generating enzyme required for sulfatase activity